jgi:hypothetical protein
MALVHDIIVYATHSENPKTEPSPQQVPNRRKLSLDIRLTVDGDSNLDSKDRLVAQLLDDTIAILVREVPNSLSVSHSLREHPHLLEREP